MLLVKNLNFFEWPYNVLVNANSWLNLKAYISSRYCCYTTSNNKHFRNHPRLVRTHKGAMWKGDSSCWTQSAEHFLFLQFHFPPHHSSEAAWHGLHYHWDFPSVHSSWATLTLNAFIHMPPTCRLEGIGQTWYTGWGKSRFTVVSTKNTEFILVLLFINYYIIFHISNCKPFAPPC